MRWLSSLVASFSGSARRREALIDVLLMASLADGALDQRDLDRIARAIETREELDGLTWTDVIVRSTQVEIDAPEFGETRARIKKNLKGEHRKFALSLAAQLLGTPLSDGERSLLLELAGDLRVPAAEHAQILEPWEEVDPFSTSYVRCEYNNPDRARRESIFDAIAHAENDIELALLTYKLCATRGAVNQVEGELAIASLGELVETEAGPFRVDAFFNAGELNYVARFIARGEAMHPRELAILPKALERVASSVKLLIGYSEALSPRDLAAIDKLDPARVVKVELEL